MKRILATIIVLILVFTLCPAVFAETHPEGLPTIYPITIDEKTVESTKPAPKECFISYASENGKEGLLCYLVGKVISTQDVDADGGTIHAFTLQTEHGYASINDTYSFMLQMYSEDDAVTLAEPDSDYSFPEVGDFVKVIGIYYGYSDSLNMPTFHYGAPRFLMSLYHPAEPEKSHAPTIGESNALKKAKNYLKSSAFSYSKLIGQLEYSGFTHEEAVYGADNCGADWFEQAAKKAESYLNTSAFSRDRLIGQLEYSGFTHEQAVYGVEANGY